jgi:hypothetical protein
MTQRLADRTVSVLRWNLLSWAQETEPVCLLPLCLLVSNEYVTPEDRDRTKSPKRGVLKQKQNYYGCPEL